MFKKVGAGAVQKPRQRRRIMIRKNCRLCENKIEYVDFKDADVLRKFQTEKGKILPRRITGNCGRHQKMVAIAVKIARELSLIY